MIRSVERKCWTKKETLAYSFSRLHHLSALQQAFVIVLPTQCQMSKEKAKEQKVFILKPLFFEKLHFSSTVKPFEFSKTSLEFYSQRKIVLDLFGKNSRTYIESLKGLPRDQSISLKLPPLICGWSTNPILQGFFIWHSFPILCLKGTILCGGFRNIKSRGFEVAFDVFFVRWNEHIIWSTPYSSISNTVVFRFKHVQFKEVFSI